MSFSCLYDFLIPYRKYTIGAFEKALGVYLTDFCSYAQALWSSSEGETSMATSTLFRAMAEMSAKVWLAQQQLQAWAFGGGLELRSASQTTCPNAGRARSPVKASRLIALACLLATAKDLFVRPPVASLHRLFLTRTEYAFSFLTTRKAVSLSCTHNVQQALL
jgi:hypothetical protein